MGVKGPSVTSALRSLAEKELVNYAPYDIITLTDKGERVARDIDRRQKVLRSFLTQVLALNPLLAEENARKMEHSMAPVVLNRLTKFMDYYDQCPGEKVRWVDSEGYFCENGLPQCVVCVQGHKDSLPVV
jgi:DtxR family Mn-dependent transcriptional regulator